MLSRFGKCLVVLLVLGIFAKAQTVAAGTRITVRSDSQINSANAHVGERNREIDADSGPV